MLAVAITTAVLMLVGIATAFIFLLRSQEPERPKRNRSTRRLEAMNKQGVSISVCMPVYNGKHFLEQAFKCLSAQTRRDFEVIVVDDGSSDGSKEACEGLMRLHGIDGRVIRQENKGCEQARDLACQYASARIIAPYDCDDEWSPTYLEEMSAALERNPDVGLVYCDFDEEFVSEGKIVRKSLTTPWINRKRAAQAGDLHVFPKGVFFDLLLQGQVLFPPVTMFRRSIYDAVQGYSSVHPTQRISLDWCFGLRTSRIASVAYLDKPLVRKSRHGGNVSGNQIKTATADVSVIDGILPSLSAGERKHAYARAAMRCTDVGYHEWEQGNTSVARQWLTKSLGYEIQKRTIKTLLKTFVPVTLLNAIRSRRAQPRGTCDTGQQPRAA